jgi:hypothetical protein
MSAPYEVAHAHLKLGNKKQAYEWLKKASVNVPTAWFWLLYESWMDPRCGVTGSTRS